MDQHILIVTTHYCPLVGGAPTVYDALARSVPPQFHVLTSKRDHANGDLVAGYHAFDRAAPYGISRLDRMRPDLRHGRVGILSRFLGQIESRLIEKKVLGAIRKIVRSEKITAICVGASEALMWLPPALKREMKIPVTLYTHGEEFAQEAYSERAMARRRLALHAVDGVIAVSSFTKKLLQEKYQVDVGNIKLLHNGVDVARFSSASANDISHIVGTEQHRKVIAAGRMVARKGFDRLIEAWPDIEKQVPGARLYLAGTGPLEAELKERIRALSLTKSVRQLGYVSGSELIALYQASDLFVMPNRTMPDGDTEGFGLVFLEAAAAGTPSIGGRAGGAVDAIVDGETGLLINGENPEDIVDAVSALLLDDERRGRMADKAYEHACRNDWHSKSRELLDFFDELQASLS